MSLRRIFLEPPERQWLGLFRYGFLAIICVLLAFDIQWFVTRPEHYPYDSYGVFIVGLGLFFNHLAFQFVLPRGVTLVLRLLAVSWMVFALLYIFLHRRPS